MLGLRTAIYPVSDLAVGGFELGLVPDGVALGAKVIEGVRDVGDGIMVAAVEDPFGNRLGIIENPNFNAADVR